MNLSYSVTGKFAENPIFRIFGIIRVYHLNFPNFDLYQDVLAILLH
jgi:hypothetical protein